MWLGNGDQPRDLFAAVKNQLTKPPILALYDPKAMTKVSADASLYGLGGVLLQKTADGKRAVALFLLLAL